MSQFTQGVIFFCLGFLQRRFTIYWTAGEEGGNFFDSCLPLPLASQALRHQPSNYCSELTSVHSQQSDLNWEPSLSKRKSLTTELPTQTFANTSHFSVIAHRKGPLQPKLKILIQLPDQYLKTTSDVNISAAQSPTIIIMFKCVISIESRTRINVVADRGYTNTLQD